MTEDQINFFKTLDPDGLDGTIQSVLLNENLKFANFEAILKMLICCILSEKRFLAKTKYRVF